MNTIVVAFAKFGIAFFFGAMRASMARDHREDELDIADAIARRDGTKEQIERIDQLEVAVRAYLIDGPHPSQNTPATNVRPIRGQSS